MDSAGHSVESTTSEQDRAVTFPDLTILVCTFNRANDLRELLRDALAQEVPSDISYEVLVVDNNSSDGTGNVVEELAQHYPLLRYVFEARQGKPNALNAGLLHARGGLLAIVDDDQAMVSTYVRDAVLAFRKRPDVALMGGKVLPRWGGTPPSWLTPEQWSPLALCDYGDREIEVEGDDAICLLSGIMRTDALRQVGGFSERMFVSEDAEVQSRLRAAGWKGLYEPSLTIYHKAPAARLTRSYYRRWHERHGRSIALMRDVALERSRMRLLGVPAHLYRAAAADFRKCVAALARGDGDSAFRYLLSLKFFWGFWKERVRQTLSSPGSPRTESDP